MHRSIDRLLWLTEDDRRVPYLELELIYDDGIRLSPSQDEIYSTYHQVLDAIANISQDLTSLEQWVGGVPVVNKTIKVGFFAPLGKDVTFQPANQFKKKKLRA